jgi:hypothetical protein
MQQVTRSIYIVDDGETVTIEIEATKVGLFITFALDGVLQTPISATPRVYRFTVSVPAGHTHFGMFSCFFPNDAPSDAKYQIFVSGALGGGKFIGSDIVKSDFPAWRRGIQFRRA